MYESMKEEMNEQLKVFMVKAFKQGSKVQVSRNKKGYGSTIVYEALNGGEKKVIIEARAYIRIDGHLGVEFLKPCGMNIKFDFNVYEHPDVSNRKLSSEFFYHLARSEKSIKQKIYKVGRIEEERRRKLCAHKG